MDKPIAIGGRPIADQLAQRTHTIVAATVELVWRQVPFYRSLPEEAVRSDVTAIIRCNFEVLIASLRSLQTTDDEGLMRIRASAQRRAEELVPLAEVLHAYHLAVDHWWKVIGDLAVPRTPLTCRGPERCCTGTCWQRQPRCWQDTAPIQRFTARRTQRGETCSWS